MKEENKPEDFHLRSHLMAAAAISESKKVLTETVEKVKWLGKYIQPAIDDLTTRRQQIDSEISTALRENKITLKDIQDISPY